MTIQPTHKTLDLPSNSAILERERSILMRIKVYYSKKLDRAITDSEVEEIRDNLLQFTKAIYEK